MINRLKTEIVVAVSTILGWVGFGTIVVHNLESWTWIQSFYFSVVTLTTVGFGDLVPTTDLTRLFVALYILIGVGAVLASLGIIGNDLIQSREQKYLKIKEKRAKRKKA